MIHHLKEQLRKREALGNLRRLSTPNGLIDFSSNDYLGLARSNLLAQLTLQEWQNQQTVLTGTGSTGSRLLTGNSRYAQQIEEKIAAFHGYETATLFTCGYMANIGLLLAVANQESCILFDAFVHASTKDGIRLSRAQSLPFRHNDIGHLEERLKKHPANRERFICIESIYSTDGAIAPLKEICQLAAQYGAHLIIDEAHAVGVVGPDGRGLTAEYNLTEYVFAQITTFGKALGTHGAVVLGDFLLKEILINYANSYIYTTALPLHTLAAINNSYTIFPKMHEARHTIQKLVDIFRKESFSESKTHIQPITIPGNSKVRGASNDLASAGFDVRPLMSPTVRRNQEALRICLHAFNDTQEVIKLLTNIQITRSKLYA
jgi:8-amino-7-oxononanoate synthase